MDASQGIFTEYKKRDAGHNAIYNVNDLLCPEFAAPGGPEQVKWVGKLPEKYLKNG